MLSLHIFLLMDLFTGKSEPGIRTRMNGHLTPGVILVGAHGSSSFIHQGNRIAAMVFDVEKGLCQRTADAGFRDEITHTGRVARATRKVYHIAIDFINGCNDALVICIVRMHIIMMNYN
jgi:hypothetical protein